MAERKKDMTTCVSIGCEFMDICKHYNFLVDRGEECKIQQDIVKTAKRHEKNKKKLKAIKNK